MANWQPIAEPLYPWANTLNRILASQNLPDISGSTAYITSDYSGGHQGSRYQIISVLYVDLAGSTEWEIERKAIRRRFLSDGRRMSFKNLNDSHRQKALIPFLGTANQLVGVSVTLAIRKSIKSLCCEQKMFRDIQKEISLQSQWTLKSFEHMLRVTHLISLLIGGLSRSKQNIYWISDEDHLFANGNKACDVARMTSAYTSHYVKHELGELGIGTTDLDEGDRLEEDLAAIPDLVAGTVAEITTHLSSISGGRLPIRIALPFDGSFTLKSELLTSWIWQSAQSLKKVVILFEEGDGKMYSVSKFDAI